MILNIQCGWNDDIKLTGSLIFIFLESRPINNLSFN